MDWAHIRKHSPEVTDRQVYKLEAMSKKVLFEEFNYFLSKQQKPEAKRAKVNRYRDGFLNSSAGYENGPSDEFKAFVLTL